MPKKPDRIISWYPARNCWRKKYRGNTYYLATGGIWKGQAEQGYEIALCEWIDIKRWVDSGQANAICPITCLTQTLWPKEMHRSIASFKSIWRNYSNSFN